MIRQSTESQSVSGGTALWTRIAPDVDIERWCRGATDHESIVKSGRFQSDIVALEASVKDERRLGQFVFGEAGQPADNVSSRPNIN